MKIEFYDKETGNTVGYQWQFYVDHEGKVLMDNCKSYESQSCTVDFDTFVEYCPNIGWRIKQE